jgi:hypothetical protein
MKLHIDWDGAEGDYESKQEAAQAIVDYCFEEMGNDKILITDVEGKEYGITLTAELWESRDD